MNFIQSEILKTIDVMNSILADPALVETVQRVGEACAQSITLGGKVMFCGNGGSAGDSQHLAAELVGKLQFDRPGMPGMALTVDTSSLTAIGNDFGFEYIFSRQIEALGHSGDVLVAISTSGKSKNVIKAMETARAKGMVNIAMTGSKQCPMATLADYWIAVPHHETQKIQEGHIVLGHIFCALVEEIIHGQRNQA